MILQWFWEPSVWIPLNLTWEDVKSTEEARYAEFSDLIYTIPIAIGILCLRYTLERILFSPLGKKLGLKNKPRLDVSPNQALQQVYNQKRTLGYNDLKTLSKKTDMDVRSIERWMRKRSALDKPTVLAKFSETAWRCLCYSCYFSFGIYAIWDKPWIWNMDDCWVGFPHHIPNEVWWYYIMEIGLYLSFMISQIWDAKRKDFWQMMVHHVVTTALLVLSWICNFTRVGIVVAVLHDAADPILEFTKILIAKKCEKASNIAFLVFFALWITTRLVMFPTLALNWTLFKIHKLLSMISAFYLFNILLLTIFYLDVLWTHFIIKIALSSFGSGKVEKDSRSDSDSDEESD